MPSREARAHFTQSIKVNNSKKLRKKSSARAGGAREGKEGGSGILSASEKKGEHSAKRGAIA